MKEVAFEIGTESHCAGEHMAVRVAGGLFRCESAFPDLLVNDCVVLR